MASVQGIKERLQALLADLVVEELDGDATIDDIEEAMVEVGDSVAREFAAQVLARRLAEAPQSPPCPDCHHPGQPAGQRKRSLVTRRGEVPIREAKYRCPKCRRHFFPSDRAVGD